jgi:putative Ca2+/H+ antiporter (TMEM165/GDT1 family)
MGLAAIITSFVIILPAELPDKTVIACLVLGSRYRPAYVFAGAAAAFAIQVALAVTAGGLLLSLLPHQVTEIIVAVLFVVGAVILLRQKQASSDESDEYVEQRQLRRSFLPVALTSFGVVFVAEFGDLTQIVTANLAAKYHDPLAVGIGATAGLWVAAGLAIIGGRSLLKVLPVKWLSRGAAAVLLVLAGLTVASLV